MKMKFEATEEQAKVITLDGSAFVTACPGAGKTRVLVERARHLLDSKGWKRGVAFLSFTQAAVSELDARLRKEGVMPSPAMPHFIGTFDSFLWRILVAPFGIPDSLVRPRLIPDLELRKVLPYKGATPIPLECFNRETGEAIPEKLKLERLGTNFVSNAHPTAALNMRARSKARGELDYQDARQLALGRLKALDTDSPLRRALVARFGEIIVDEAQDCNPDDLCIIEWFVNAGIPVKIICDPQQSIYSFRGGVSNELETFAAKFEKGQRRSLTGNFRSSKHIVSAVARLKRPESGRPYDEALGEHRDEPTPVYLLSYPGNTVPSTVGDYFASLATQLNIPANHCPVVSSTRLSAARALGLPVRGDSTCLAYRLATAVGDLHSSFDLGQRQDALEEMHRVVLTIEGHLAQKTYRQHIDALNDQYQSWRPEILALGKELRYDPKRHEDANGWLQHAREILKKKLPPDGGKSIKKVLQRPKNEMLEEALQQPALHGLSARTIHSVKGAEFPAICVVLSTRNAKGVIDYLETGAPASMAEELRKLYVGASRAQRLLAIATPRSQVTRLETLLSNPADAFGLKVISL